MNEPLLRKIPVCPSEPAEPPGVPEMKISPRWTSPRLISLSLVPDIPNKVSVLPIEPADRNPPAIMAKNTDELQS
ncbi:hypothetical protein BK5-Tp28 [Lactococcus phage BK5-T]|uniref:Uncharacterized protein n=1 Tax=Lactococcus phage BK5-T TaxID=31754 RepID=Q94M97_9CAUD|nr:hypothetical protein BK5-Tp28 [Lactococcus phage BK5-T]YP_010133248.1 hypothetical protein K3164_gp28 [Lactococcus phage BK5-T]AAK56822.1 unknown [Lactococcus phage BK5-T]CAC80169.1 hypothetical protein [Lactococcus phage BK5-T]